MWRANARRTGCFDAPGAPDLVEPARQLLVIDYATRSLSVGDGLACYGDAFDNLEIVACDVAAHEHRWLWQLHPESSELRTHPAITRELAFVYATSGEDTLLAVDARSGFPRWRVRFRPGTGHVAEADRVVYATCGGGLLAIDARTGDARTLWDAWLRGTMPAVGDGIVCAFGDGELRAFSHPAGEPRWTRAIVGTVPVVAAGHVVTQLRTDTETAVCALDTATGETCWQAPGGADPIAVLDQLVCAADGNAIRAHDLRTGELVWRVELPGDVDDLAGASGVLYASVGYRRDAAGRHAGVVVALDAATGTRRWERPVAGAGTIAITGDVVLVTGAPPEGGDVDYGVLDSCDQSTVDRALVRVRRHAPDAELARRRDEMFAGDEARGELGLAHVRAIAAALAPWGIAAAAIIERRPDDDAARLVDPCRVVHAALAQVLPVAARDAIADALCGGVPHELGSALDLACDLYGARCWQLAVARDAVVPVDFPVGVAGARFAELADPFAMSLALWRAGGALVALDPERTVLTVG